MDTVMFQWAEVGLLSGILATLITIALMNTAAAGGGIPKWMKDEPLRLRAAGAAIVGAVVVLLASLGIDVDPKVQAAIIGLIGTIAVAISELSRPKVTPVDKGDQAGHSPDSKAS